MQRIMYRILLVYVVLFSSRGNYVMSNIKEQDPDPSNHNNLSTVFRELEYCHLLCIYTVYTSSKGFQCFKVCNC